MNMGQDRQMQMVRGNDGNQFKQYNDKMLGIRMGIMYYRMSRIRLFLNAFQNSRRSQECWKSGNRQIKKYVCCYLQTQLLIAQKEEAGIQLQAKEFDLMAAIVDLDEIEEFNEN
ncbi:hypothetical protein Tco_0923828 [Tanacetum coccineum]|uniref:Uncharacterized protein n=1 Tax=Tanacetum coccineum TaxID=301880 RepID=A0ABQ5D347_9ASTR